MSVVGQSKFQSWLETCANTAIGYLVALLSQIAVFPMFGIHVPMSTNIGIGLWFTAISIVRSFVLRRTFNAIHVYQSAPRKEKPIYPPGYAVFREGMHKKGGMNRDPDPNYRPPKPQSF